MRRKIEMGVIQACQTHEPSRTPHLNSKPKPQSGIEPRNNVQKQNEIMKEEKKKGNRNLIQFTLPFPIYLVSSSTYT
jgi:hypothetical protein